MKKKNILIILIIAAFGTLYGCKEDFLEVNPKGSLDAATLATEDGIEALLIGAYSMLDGTAGMGFGWEAASSNWVFGAIRGMTGNKGTDSGDQPDINPIQTFSESTTNPYLNVKWRSVYEAISRCNGVILTVNQALDLGNIDQAQADGFIQQARALRGWFHFEAQRMWEKVPYVDETTDQNTLTNDADISAQIIADLTEGTKLPNSMGQIGRFNGTVAKALLAKVHMQSGNYSAALPLLIDVRDNGTKPDGSAIGLASTFAEIFNISERNGIESVYTIQYSVNDGSGGWNGGWGEVLNFPYKGGGGSPGGCCGFFQPTQEFVNSFRTDAVTGLPLDPATYNAGADLRDQAIKAGADWVVQKYAPGDEPDGYTTDYKKGDAVTAYDPAEPFLDLAYIALTDNTGKDPLTNPSDWQLTWTEDNSLSIDPRLDVTTGRRGIPYLDWGNHTGSDWIRDQTYAGPYSPKKQVYRLSDEGSTTEVGNWTSGWTANGYRMIRYADILLMIAECEIETNGGDLGIGEINQVRARAANTDGWVLEDDDATYAANYVIAEYTAFADQAAARTALRMERKLELGMEGHRWYDLNRWGNTQTELSRVLTYESGMAWGSSMYGSASVGPEDATYPIPQRQIDLSLGNLVQNR